MNKTLGEIFLLYFLPLKTKYEVQKLLSKQKLNENKYGKKFQI